MRLEISAKLFIFTALLFITMANLPIAYSQDTITSDDGTQTDTGAEESKPKPESDNTKPITVELINPFGEGADLESVLRKIIDWLIVIATPIAVGMIIYGAYQMLFAFGDPAKFKSGRQTIFYTAIGYAIILIGWGFASLIQELITP